MTKMEEVHIEFEACHILRFVYRNLPILIIVSRHNQRGRNDGVREQFHTKNLDVLLVQLALIHYRTC